MPGWRHSYLGLMLVMLSSCSQNNESQSYDAELLAVARASHLQPVTEYGDLFVPALTGQLGSSDQAFELGEYDRALEHALSAEIYIDNHDIEDSLLLLPVLDRIVRSSVAMQHWQEADRAQHRYHAVIAQHFGDNASVLNRADFRIGCWHYLVQDWYQAQFDFDDAIQRLEQSGSKSPKDEQLLKDSRVFEATVAFNCRPPGPLP